MNDWLFLVLALLALVAVILMVIASGPPPQKPRRYRAGEPFERKDVDRIEKP